MVDILTKKERSKRMSLIRSKNTSPELAVRSLLHSLGYRFRIHRKDLPGQPDITFPTRKKVIFVHGCFWHGHENCKISNIPKSRTDFWIEKFSKNQERDARNIARLREAGWDVMVVWECEAKSPAELKEGLETFLGPARTKP
jgi:DNA mismatch endonuclease (patch repair protein)